MEAPTAQQPPPETEQAALAALTLMLLSGMSLQAITPQSLPVFQALGIGPSFAALALSLIPGDLGYPRTGLAQLHIARTSAPRRAAYLVSAARRLQEGGELEQERHHMRQHVAAERGRIQSAAEVDRVAAEHGPVLGWAAKQPFDAVSSAGCKARHRSNFRVDRPPMVEGRPSYPGAVHPGCRCRAVPPWPQGKMLR